MGDDASQPVVRKAGVFSLGRVLALYRRCFDPTQQLRSVAASPLLFRAWHAYLISRGRCRAFLAWEGKTPVGFAIVRVDGRPSDPWLLSAIGVLDTARGRGVARALFAAASRGRAIRLTVEEGGAVGFYESLGLARTGERTLIYFQQAHVAALDKIPPGDGAVGDVLRAQAVNRRAFLLKSPAVGQACQDLARRKLARYPWGILELPRRVDVPEGLFPTVVHEVEFSSRPP